METLDTARCGHGCELGPGYEDFLLYMKHVASILQVNYTSTLKVVISYNMASPRI